VGDFIIISYIISTHTHKNTPKDTMDLDLMRFCGLSSVAWSLWQSLSSRIVAEHVWRLEREHKMERRDMIGVE